MTAIDNNDTPTLHPDGIYPRGTEVIVAQDATIASGAEAYVRIRGQRCIIVSDGLDPDGDYKVALASDDAIVGWAHPRHVTLASRQAQPEHHPSGTRVWVAEGARTARGRSGFEGAWAVVVSGPDSSGDYFVRRESDDSHTWVHRESLSLTAPEPEAAEPQTFAANTRVWIASDARSAGGPSHLQGMWGEVLSGPDDSGDYFVRDAADPARTAWVRKEDLSLTDPASGTSTTEPDVAEALRAYVREMEERWETLSEALNEKADEQDWCSDFESVVRPLGLPGRTRMAYDVDVTVTIEYTLDESNTSTDFDRALSEEVGHEIGHFSGTISVEIPITVHIGGVSDSDEAEGEVDSEHIEARLDAMGVSYDGIVDWDVRSSSACHDTSHN